MSALIESFPIGSGVGVVGVSENLCTPDSDLERGRAFAPTYKFIASIICNQRFLSRLSLTQYTALKDKLGLSIAALRTENNALFLKFLLMSNQVDSQGGRLFVAILNACKSKIKC